MPLNKETEPNVCISHSAITVEKYMNPIILPAHWPSARVFANDPGDLGSNPVRVIPKTIKMELDTSLLNTQQYKVRIEGKVGQSSERSIPLPYTSV